MADDEYAGGGVRRQNGRLGGAAAPRWEAKATALSHSAEPNRSCAHQRESALAQFAPQCDFSDQPNKRGKQAQSGGVETDLVRMLQKKQRNFGRYEAMKYFMQDDVKRLSWSAPILNDGKVDSNDGTIVDGGIFVSSLKCF